MTEPLLTIILIEDEKHIRRFVRASLEREGMRVVEAGTGREGLSTAAVSRPDLVIVDLGLPDIDGVEVIRVLRDWSAVPAIVLSARSKEEDKVAALNAGADDYITKPFGAAELTARIRALLRRQSCSGTNGMSKIAFGDVLVDFDARVVERDGHTIHLTPIEYRLLVALARHAGCVPTQRQLLQEVWGPAHAENAHYLRIYMGHLRHKLERDPAQPVHIVTETGVGYRLVGVR
ncbi:DNA-binding response regulator in two-component regulatory system with KdpD [Paraburkholderia piptadeniae]|uniref:DNA-binding response regulator in two-component regulatory system with KdpD n=1 Tax=Paraburkholderia piptadeniae TaxID=1701573 RepID=A0A1N7RU38_9BURK|nr:response regulator [Paraburkholderia piptadeniae]SIT38604.1 DNA-binding response regulator in two-component regulatory system with KdpD [Paraburkholderia piptadeniae]